MLENLSFTDAQGQTFTTAVVRVKSADLNTHSTSTSNESFSIDLTDLTKPVTVNNQNHDNTNIDLNAQFVYWPSAEAYSAGHQPYQLMFQKNGSFTSSLYLSKQDLSDEKYTGLSLEEKCELYFTDSILPTLTTTETP